MNENLNPDGLDGPAGADTPDLWLVDRLMTGVDLPGGTPERERVRMQHLVDALRAPGTAAELADRESFLTAFDQVTTRDRTSARTIVLGTRAAVVAGIAVLAAATGAAAYTGSLPGPLQRAAHSTIGAPAADEGSDEATDEPTGSPTDTPTGSPTESPTGSPSGTQGVGPDATGPAAFGLCTAWAHGGLAKTSVAYRNLAVAAGGADGIQAYCATVVKPGGGSTSGSGSPTSHPGHGSPTSHPSHSSPTSHPGPSEQPTGSPTTHPGGH